MKGGKQQKKFIHSILKKPPQTPGKDHVVFLPFFARQWVAKFKYEIYSASIFFSPLKLFLWFPIKINNFFRQNTGITLFFHNIIPDR